MLVQRWGQKYYLFKYKAIILAMFCTSNTVCRSLLGVCKSRCSKAIQFIFNNKVENYYFGLVFGIAYTNPLKNKIL